MNCGVIYIIINCEVIYKVGYCKCIHTEDGWPLPNFRFIIVSFFGHCK